MHSDPKNTVMIFSVIISTYNRASLLRSAVSSVLNQDFDRQRYEIIVVDNNSTDATRSVVEELINANPQARITYLFEKEQGLSAARNAGARAAEGEILAFIDDDSEAEPGWLAALQEAYLTDESAASVGGKILPEWIGGKPEWFPQIAETINSLDMGEEPTEFVFPMHPFGGNLSVRKTVMERLGGFSTALGRKKRGYLSNEEKDFYSRLERLGPGKVLYAPEAVVMHKAFRLRLTRRYLLGRFYWQGISEAICEQEANSPRRTALLISGLKRAGEIFRNGIRLIPRVLSGKPETYLNDVVRLSCEIGYCRQEIVGAFFPK